MDLHTHVRALNEKRMNAVNALNNHLEECHRRHPGVKMSAAEKATEDRINAEIDEYEAEIRRYVDQDRRERDSAGLRESYASVFGGAVAAAEFSTEAPELRALLRGEIDPRSGARRAMDLPLALAARERDLYRQGASPLDIRNALQWDTGNIASAVPRSMARALYETLEAEVSMFRAPTTKVTTTGGEPMDFPKLTTHSIATQVIAQGTAIGGTDPAFNKMTLDAYKYGELVYVSSEAVEDTAVDIVAFLGRDIGRALGRVIDADLVLGTGTGEPRGLFTAAIADGGSVITGGTLIPASYETLVDLAYGIADSYRQRGTCGWMFRDSTAAAFRKLRDGAGGTVGAPLWEPSLTNGIQGGQPDRLLGYPVYPDMNVAAQGSASRSIFFGDFSAYFIRQVGDVRIERSDDFKFSEDMVTIRGKWRVDGDLIDAGAVITSKQAPS
jgi:HK97 family phage major capsid protein